MNRGLGVAALLIALTTQGSTAAQEANWRDGRKVFKQCKSCHTFKEGKHRFGPSLAGVFDRRAGTAPGFAYSKPMREESAQGLVWNAETFDKFLAAPAKFIAKTKMRFKGLPSAQDRRDVFAYIKRRAKKR